jgi:hypothetical protein
LVVRLVGLANRGEGEKCGVSRKGEEVTGKRGVWLPSHVGLHREEFTKRRENGAFGLQVFFEEGSAYRLVNGIYFVIFMCENRSS